MGGTQTGYRRWSRCGALPERVLRGYVFRHDFHLPAIAISRRGFLRFAGAGLSLAGSHGAGGSSEESGGDFSAEPWFSLRDSLQAARLEVSAECALLTSRLLA